MFYLLCLRVICSNLFGGSLALRRRKSWAATNTSGQLPCMFSKLINLWHRQPKVFRKNPAGLVPCSLLKGKRKPAHHRPHQGFIKFVLLPWVLQVYKLLFDFLFWKLCCFNKHAHMKLKNISLFDCNLTNSFQTSPEIWKAHFWVVVGALRVRALLHNKECMTEL